ncbi:hypothetical protein TTHERM_00202790 (macronuclear) [Tetrahymena thermophila SB210]|uniref:Uncharacterized protein n=1 Tax=Tetrahymena thermophila (strain SB210) TaxID=312017 RepID=Q22NG6_TETTS|nr:hypothetical protein TTHERM_00202790 [Tetrahymena thermophila SB210]EAR86819.2 hypothetical protein TTHERM_00202790 [Tetrahymena thermophila SB210]|eukprot:XP_001007064.2 hypothetical protein TTHERM_00202790 [Tetrahymena thermophila SB210]
MSQKLICPVHLDNPIIFLNMEKCQESALSCALCVSEKQHQYNLLPIQKLKQIDEESLFDSWPPFQERKYDNVNDIRKEVKILIESKQQKVEEINNWFDQLLTQIHNQIIEKKNSILRQAEKASQLREDIIKKYFEYSQNLNIKKCLKSNQSVDQIEKQLQNLIKQVHEKSESQTLMFQNLISFYKFINSYNKYPLQDSQEDIIISIKNIDFFNFNTEDIDLSGSNIENLFSDQDNFDELRKLISEKTKEDYDSFKELDIFMKNSQNQISTTNSFIASDICQQLNFLKIENNKQKQIDIRFDNLNFNLFKIERSQLFCYFKKGLNPKKKYTFRIRSKSFVSGSTKINVGLIKSLKEYFPDIDIKINNNHNNTNTQTEELEFRICINDNLFTVMSYPNYNTICRYTILYKQINNASLTNQKAEKNNFQSQSQISIFGKKVDQQNISQNLFSQNQSNNCNNNTNFQNQEKIQINSPTCSLFGQNNCANNDCITRQGNESVSQSIFQNFSLGNSHNQQYQEKTKLYPAYSQGLISKNNVGLFSNLNQNPTQILSSQDTQNINTQQKEPASLTQNPTNCNNNGTNQINSQQQNLFNISIGNNQNQQYQEKTNQCPQIQEASSQGLISKNNVGIFQTNLKQNPAQVQSSQDTLQANIQQKESANLIQNPTNCSNDNTNQINSQQQGLFQPYLNNKNTNNTVLETQRGNTFQSSQYSQGIFGEKMIPDNWRDNTTSYQQQQNNTPLFATQKFQQQQNTLNQQTQKINEQRNNQILQNGIFQNQSSLLEYYFAIQFIYWNGDEQFTVTYFSESDSYIDGVYKQSF